MLFTFPVSLRGKSFRHRCAMMPAARASPRTLIMVRNLSLRVQKGALSDSKHKKPSLLDTTIVTDIQHLQDPINGHNQCDVIGRQAHRGEDDHHGNQSSLRDAGGSDAGGCGRDAGRRGRRSESSCLLEEQMRESSAYGRIASSARRRKLFLLRPGETPHLMVTSWPRSSS